MLNRIVKSLLAIVVFASYFMFTPAAQATTCAAYQSEWNVTSFVSSETRVYTEIRYRICTGNLGNQFVDLAYAQFGYYWEVGGTPCSGIASLEKIIYNTNFWDSNDSYNPAPVTIACQSDGHGNHVQYLSTAPDLRVDQLAKWQNLITVVRNTAPDLNATHSGRYY